VQISSLIATKRRANSHSFDLRRIEREREKERLLQSISIVGGGSLKLIPDGK
jgi:hypothetical protein